MCSVEHHQAYRGRQGANEEFAEIARACTVKPTTIDPVFVLIEIDFDSISFVINAKGNFRKFDVGKRVQ